MLRRVTAATALLGFGISVGVAIGSLWDLPRLLLRLFQETPARVDLRRPAGEPLQAFRALQQRRAPERSPLPTVATAPGAPSPPAREQVAQPGAFERAMAQLAARHRDDESDSAKVVIQIASYTDRRSADALATRLRRSGFQAYVSHTRPEGKPRYRVRVRPSGGLAPRELAARLKDHGFSVWVTSE
ncbi:MAG: SPOR domain-containing protein [Myxococcota bacterium]